MEAIIRAYSPLGYTSLAVTIRGSKREGVIQNIEEKER